MVDLEEIEALAMEKPIEEILKKLSWKEFEGIVAEIFGRHGFFVKKNFRFKTRKRYEIDIIATKNNLVFCVDCKRWKGGRYKKSGIKKSVEEQEKRVKTLNKFLRKNPISKGILKIGDDFKLKPLIVTLMEEDLIKDGNTFIVPIFKLNSFLLEFENLI